MKVLLFAAHGSRKKESNKEVISFYEKVVKRLGDYIDESACCFLEFQEPHIEDAIIDKIEKGADIIYIFPYFLFNGTHVSVDIPAIADKFPDTEIKILKSLGQIEGFDGFIADFLTREL